MNQVDPSLRAAIEASGDEDYAELREAIKASEPAPRLRGEIPGFVAIDEMPFFAQGSEIELTACPTITSDELDAKHDLMGELTRSASKIELCTMLNEIALSEGQPATFTPAMLSAVASARIRQQQKQNRKTKRR